jgi:hypothetical protein
MFTGLKTSGSILTHYLFFPFVHAFEFELKQHFSLDEHSRMLAFGSHV